MTRMKGILQMEDYQFLVKIIRNLADTVAAHVGFRETDGNENAVQYTEELLGFVKDKGAHASGAAGGYGSAFSGKAQL
jgi:hypothetical protein